MFTVTRQNQWPDGDLVVEISEGGLDYCNPGALSERYPGEFEQFEDPREAVETAIKIGEAWKKDKPDEEIGIAHGSTGGMTMPFSGEELSEDVFSELREWAKQEWESLEKCAHCGEILGKERYGCHEIGEYDCCSEYCADEHYFSEVDEEE